jgi:hypothetical protein
MTNVTLTDVTLSLSKGAFGLSDLRTSGLLKRIAT